MADNNFVANLIVRMRMEGAGSIAAEAQRALNSIAAAAPDLGPKATAQAIAGVRTAAEQQITLLPANEQAAARAAVTKATQKLVNGLTDIIDKALATATLGFETKGGVKTPRQVPVTTAQTQSFIKAEAAGEVPAVSKTANAKINAALNREATQAEEGAAAAAETAQETKKSARAAKKKARAAERSANAEEQIAADTEEEAREVRAEKGRKRGRKGKGRRGAVANLNAPRIDYTDIADELADIEAEDLPPAKKTAKRTRRQARHRRETRQELAGPEGGPPTELAGDVAGDTALKTRILAQVNTLLAAMGGYAKSAAEAATQMEIVRGQIAQIRATDPRDIEARVTRKIAGAEGKAEEAESIAAEPRGFDRYRVRADVAGDVSRIAQEEERRSRPGALEARAVRVASVEETRARMTELLASLGDYAKHAAASATAMQRVQNQVLEIQVNDPRAREQAGQTRVLQTQKQANIATDLERTGELAAPQAQLETAEEGIRGQVYKLLADLGKFAENAAAAAQEMARVRRQIAELRAQNVDLQKEEAATLTARLEETAGTLEQVDVGRAGGARARITTAEAGIGAEEQRQLRAPDKQRALEDEALEKRVTTMVRETAVLNRLTANEESALKEEALNTIATRRHSRARSQVAAILEREQNRGLGVLPGGSLFQRVQAYASQRTTGQVQDPRQFQTLGQGIASRAITTAGYGISGAALYGGIQAMQEMVREASELDRIMSQVKRQFAEADDSASFPQFRRSMLEIARESGVAADDVATVGFQMRGAFDSTTRAVEETRGAIRASVVTGIEQKELTDSLTGAAISYGTSIEGVTDKAIGLEERFGVLARESLKVFGDMAATATEAGLSLDELGAILGTVQQASGRSGAAIAESLGRILPAIGESSAALVQAYQGTPALAGQADQIAESLGKGETGQVLVSLTENWDRLDKGTQQYFTSLLGGRREASTLNALFNNNSEAIAELNRLQDDGGKTTERFNDVQQTLSGTMARLRQEFIQIGDALARAGLFDALKLIAGATLVVVQAVAAGARMFGDLNEALKTVPGRLLAVAAALLAIRAAMRGASAVRGIADEVGGRRGGGLRGAAAEVALGLPPGILTGGGKAAGGGAVAAAEAAGTTATGGAFRARRNPSRVAREAAQEASEELVDGMESGARTGLRTRARTSAGRIGRYTQGLLPTYGSLGEAFPTAGQIPGAVTRTPGVVAGGVRGAGTRIAGGFSAARAAGVGGIARGAGGLALGGLLAAGPMALVAIDIALIEKFFNDRQKLQEGIQKARTDISEKLRSKSAEELKAYEDSGMFDMSFGEKLGAFLTGETTTETLLHRMQDEKRTQLLIAAQRNPEILEAMGINEGDVDDILADIKSGGDKGREAGDRADVVIANVQGKNRDDLLVAAGQVSKEAESAKTSGQSNLKTMQETQAAFDAGEISYGEWLKAMQGEVTTLQNLAAGGRPDQKEALLEGQRRMRQGIQAQIQKELERASFFNELAGGDVQGEIDALMKVFSANADKVAPGDIETRTREEKVWDPNAEVSEESKRAAAARGLPSRRKGDFVTKTIAEEFEKGTGRRVVEENAPNFNPETEVKRGGLTPEAQTDLDMQLAQRIRDRWMQEIERAPSAEEAKRIAAEGPKLSDEETTRLARLGGIGGKALAAMFGIDFDTAQSIKDRELDEALGALDVASAQTRDPAAQAANAKKAAQLRKDAAGADVTKNQEADKAIADAAEQGRQSTEDIARSRIELRRAQAGGDPMAEARAAIDEANLQTKGASGTAAINRASAARADAARQMQDAQTDVDKARIDLFRAQHPEDAVAQAEAGIRDADLEACNARGPAAQLRAQASRLAANKALQDALSEQADAESDLFRALATQRGDDLGAVQRSLGDAQRHLQDAIGRGAGKDVIDRLRAEVVNSQTQVHQQSLNDQKSLVDFNLAMGNITTQQAVAQYQGFLQMQDLTENERREILQHIKQLQDQASGADLQFNLPTDLDLPTLYTARRANQDMTRVGQGQTFANVNAGQSNYDNRSINVVLNASNAVDGEAALQTIVEALNEAPRYGTQPHLY